MISDHEALPSFETILQRLDFDPGRRGRTRCLFHGAENPSAFSYSEERGFFLCFACGEKGDRITLVMKALGVGFREAIAWLGVETRRHTGTIRRSIDPEQARARQLELGLKIWAKAEARKFRDEFLARERFQTFALERLEENIENEIGWRLLECAYTGKDRVEYCLDLLEGSPEDQLHVFREMELMR